MNTDNAEYLYAVKLMVKTALAPVLETGFESVEWNITAWEDVDAGETVFREYFETEKEAAERLSEMRPLLGQWLNKDHWILELEQLPRENWAEYWKRFFHTKKVSDHIIIKPSWEEYAAVPGEVIIELDPGMSFGTGQHPTTRTCLTILDYLHRDYSGSTFLDLGCGSGILSIAAVKLGFNHVTGIDNDPLAVAIARANALINGVEKQIHFMVDDLSDIRLSGRFQIIVINMLADSLRKFARVAEGLMASSPDSKMIVAGMLDSQYDETIIMYKELMLRELNLYHKDGWSTAVLVRQ